MRSREGRGRSRAGAEQEERSRRSGAGQEWSRAGAEQGRSGAEQEMACISRAAEDSLVAGGLVELDGDPDQWLEPPAE